VNGPATDKLQSSPIADISRSRDAAPDDAA
jgi:hypothetical protein